MIGKGQLARIRSEVTPVSSAKLTRTRKKPDRIRRGRRTAAPPRRLGTVSDRNVRERNVMVAAVDDGGDVLDTVVPVLFTIATIALSVVTLGVIYLNVSSWLESRSEPKKKQLEKKEYDDSMKEFMTDARRSQSKAKKPIKKATDKGFGPS